MAIEKGPILRESMASSRGRAIKLSPFMRLEETLAILFRRPSLDSEFSMYWVINCTLGFLAKLSFTPLLYHPGGCLGCPEKETRSRNYNLFVRSAVFQPKWNDVQKTYKNHQNPVKSYCFLGYFQSLFNFGWKTAAQTN